MDPDSSRAPEPAGPARQRSRSTRALRVTVTDGRGRPVRDEGLARWLASVLPARLGGEVAIALASDAQVRTLNRRYRRTDRPTDVLSFASGDSPFLGDVVIATGVARRQARAMGHAYRTELRVLALHGLLHLLGYDHEARDDQGRMARMEARLRRQGGLRTGLIARASTKSPRASLKKRLRPERAAGGKR